MTQTFEAIYENGLLRPLQPLEGIPEHGKIRLTVDAEARQPHPLLKYCGTVSDADTAEIARIIEEEFEQVNPDDWR